MKCFAPPRKHCRAAHLKRFASLCVLPGQKYGRSARLQRFAALPISSCSRCSFTRHRRRNIANHLSSVPSSATGSGTLLRPGTLRLASGSSVFPKQKNTAVAVLFCLAGAEGLEPSARGFGEFPKKNYCALCCVV